MPQNKDLKRLVRARMAETGENYTRALSAVLGATGLEPVPGPWHMSGSHRADYEAGLLPDAIAYRDSVGNRPGKAEAPRRGRTRW